jgi:hypothetical protein
MRRLAGIVLCGLASVAVASPHTDRLAAINSAYRADLALCKKSGLAGERLKTCYWDAAAARTKATDEATAEKGRRGLVVREHRIEAARAKAAKAKAATAGSIPPMTNPVKP